MLARFDVCPVTNKRGNHLLASYPMLRSGTVVKDVNTVLGQFQSNWSQIKN
ncbi:hypothetical protein MGA5115_00839 [Marinomonas gallaica]|uniref:Uncharacterized protein n=1 Tax=Marinomonas gallaica TaxID=1806667 RepID=A0A1C3JNM9_9GAMM|nr:hypothetical protein MGA5115_00839 [Marinomonas gallaica]SBT20471.1 hypothetical protein MGA5116_01057 [Marinomonas gallaica]